MPNPMLQQLMGNRANSFIGAYNNMKQILQSGNPDAMFQQMMNSNPQFRQFVQQNQGKSPEQIADAYGIDFNQIRKLLG